MFALVEWTAEGRRGTAVREHRIADVRFCAAALLRRPGTPAFLLRRRCISAAKELQKRGVTRAVFPEHFPCAALFARQGVFPVETLPFYRAAAAELVRCALEKQGVPAHRAVAGVYARRYTAELERMISALCVRTRYIHLCAPECDALCRRLRRECGAAVVLLADPAQLTGTDVAVALDPEKLPDGGAHLELYPGGETPPYTLFAPPAVEREIPPGCDRTALLAVLWSAGALRPEQVEARGNCAPA